MTSSGCAHIFHHRDPHSENLMFSTIFAAPLATKWAIAQVSPGPKWVHGPSGHMARFLGHLAWQSSKGFYYWNILKFLIFLNFWFLNTSYTSRHHFHAFPCVQRFWMLGPKWCEALSHDGQKCKTGPAQVEGIFQKFFNFWSTLICVAHVFVVKSELSVFQWCP